MSRLDGPLDGVSQDQEEMEGKDKLGEKREPKERKEPERGGNEKRDMGRTWEGHGKDMERTGNGDLTRLESTRTTRNGYTPLS